MLPTARAAAYCNGPCDQIDSVAANRISFPDPLLGRSRDSGSSLHEEPFVSHATCPWKLERGLTSRLRHPGATIP